MSARFEKWPHANFVNPFVLSTPCLALICIQNNNKPSQMINKPLFKLILGLLDIFFAYKMVNWEKLPYTNATINPKTQ
jgi:hypothetical protein